MGFGGRTRMRLLLPLVALITVAVGGVIRIVNGCTVDAGRVTEVRLPSDWLARFQVVEYLRAFLGGRVAMSAMNALLIVSGAFGVRIGVRTGVHTGEVFAGDPAQGDPFATGDAVVVAQRLEATAGAGEILVGDATIRLVRDAVTVEAVPALMLKGKSEPVVPHALLGATGRDPAWTAG